MISSSSKGDKNKQLFDTELDYSLMQYNNINTVSTQFCWRGII